MEVKLGTVTEFKLGTVTEFCNEISIHLLHFHDPDSHKDGHRQTADVQRLYGIRISVNVLLSNSVLCISVQQIYVRLYLLPTDCTSVGYNACYFFSDMYRLITISVLSEIVDTS